MGNILASWICIDSGANASWFPSSKGSSADKKIQDIYWKCLAVCMFTARYFNQEIQLQVFSNIAELPVVDNIDFSDLFRQLNIRFYTTAFENQTPEGYYGHWRNQFYEFSIFKYIISSADFKPDDCFCLIDSDCVITGDLSPMFSSIAENGSISYKMAYSPEHVINGLSRLDMRQIYADILKRDFQEAPDYYAGEYFGATIDTTAKLLNEFSTLWPVLLRRHKDNLPRLHEEAHVLSFLYHITGYENNYANRYIKRLWTDPTTYRSVENGDESLLIWHLPAEKRVGFRYLFSMLSLNEFKMDAIRATALLDKLKHIFTIPEIPLRRKMYYFIKSIAKKLVKGKLINYIKKRS
jgi:hypothetical protein